MPAATCAHGFAPGTCLICQTLGTGQPASAKPDAGPKRAGSLKRAASPKRNAPVPAGGVHVLPAPRRRLTLGTRLLGLAVVAAAVALALWWIVAVAAAVLHIAELAAMGVVTGWVGWKLGVRHGRHGH